MSRSKADQEREKVIQERCQILLSRLLKEEDNKYCVDCDSKGPRWASWNIGVFLCIRCAGIHRNLGVHISKVRSVNLDSWTPAQVSSMQCMGNSRGRAVYEASVPDDFKRPNSDSGLEQFIRSKYEKKKYIMKDWVATKPPDLPEGWQALIEQEKLGKVRDGKQLSVPTSSSAVNNTSKSPETRTTASQETRTTSINKTNNHQLVSSGVSKSSSVSSLSAGLSSTVSSHSVDLLGLSAAAASQEDDDPFSNFVSAPAVSSGAAAADSSTTTRASVSSSLEQDFFNQVSTPSNNVNTGTTSAGGGENSKMSNSSIMALFSSVPQNKGPTMIASPAAPQALGYPQQQQQQSLGYPQQQQSLYPTHQLQQAFPQQQQQHFPGGQQQVHQVSPMFNNNVATTAADPLSGLKSVSCLDPLASLTLKHHQTSSGGGQGNTASQNIFQMNNQFSGLNLQANHQQSFPPQQNHNQLTPTSIQGLYNSAPTMTQSGLSNNLFPGGQMSTSNSLFSSPNVNPAAASLFSSPGSGHQPAGQPGQGAVNSLWN